MKIFISDEEIASGTSGLITNQTIFVEDSERIKEIRIRRIDGRFKSDPSSFSFEIQFKGDTLPYKLLEEENKQSGYHLRESRAGYVALSGLITGAHRLNDFIITTFDSFPSEEINIIQDALMSVVTLPIMRQKRYARFFDDEEIYWHKQILELIGPVPKKLKQYGENSREAFHRLLKEVEDAQNKSRYVNSTKDLIHFLNAYPNFYIQAIISEERVVNDGIEMGRESSSLQTLLEKINDTHKLEIFNILYLKESYLFKAIPNAYNFYVLCEEDSIYRNQLLDYVLSHPTISSKLLDSICWITYLCRDNPDYQDQIIKHVLENDDCFVRIFEGCHELEFLCHTFPDYRERLMIHVFESDVHFMRIFDSSLSLEYVCRHTAPDYREQVMDSIFENVNRFIQIFKNANDAQHICREMPDYCERIVTHILENESLFSRVFNKDHDVRHFCNVIKNYSDRVLTHILVNENHFNRIISNKDALDRICITYPEYAEQFQQTFMEKNERAVGRAYS